MTKPEKRWQLLLVADDGRIIPFKRIKGIAVTLVILLVLLGLVCTGLGWQLKLEMGRHRQTLDQLASAELEAARYKREHEFITAELVLAEARMEKAGLPIPKRQVWTAEQTSEPSVDVPPVVDMTADDRQAESEADTKPLALSEKPPSASVSLKQSPAIEETGTKVFQTKSPSSAVPPAVVLSDLVMQHDTQRKTLRARFRVTNTGPRSSPVAGRCLVVLKSDRTDSSAWLSLPEGALVNGKPDAGRGQRFKISHFRNMEMAAVARTDPSVFKTATVYVFDTTGAVLLERDFPIDLPGFMPEPQSSTPMETPIPADSTLATKPVASVVAIDDLEMKHDTERKVLKARFRVQNNGPRSSPVAGRYLVVLKSDTVDAKAWLSLPDGALVDGKPAGDKGRVFKISSFKVMTIEAAARTDPSAYKFATVYIFDPAGAVLLEKAFPVDLPAPVAEPKPEPVSRVAEPPADAAAEDDTVVPPTDDPSVLENSAPTTGADSRARF